MGARLSTDDVIAFRLNAHNLAERVDGSRLVEAAGRCGVQNSPPGSALLALHARVRDVSRARLDEAVAGEKSLLQTWSMRGAPFFLPTADAVVFTTGVLPPTEQAMRHLIHGVEPELDRLGLSLTEAVERIGVELPGVLAGRRLGITELGAEVASRVASGLPPEQRAVWQLEGPHAPGQPIGEAVVHFCIRILTLQGIVCFAPRAGNKAPFVLVQEWLGRPLPETDPKLARAELLRRYLRCYGPSTRGDFAAWLGVYAGDVGAWWDLVEGELTKVDFGGTAWMLTEDLDAVAAAPTPTGVRLLPPRDPYSQLRDRDTILDRRRHRAVYKTIGEPGTVLVDGRIVGTWRPRRSGRRLTVHVTAFDTIRDRQKAAVRVEAEQLAPLRGAATAEVEFEGG